MNDVGRFSVKAVQRAAAKWETPPGWYRPKVYWLAQFEKFQGHPAEEGDKFQIAKLVKYTRDGLAAGNETTFELGHEMLGFYVRKGQFPGKKSRAQLEARARGTVQAHIHAYHEAHSGGFFSHLNPVKLISAAANVISKVAPFVDMAIKLVPGAGQIYSLAKSGVSLGMSLAKGRPITEAFADAAIAALPGGELAQRAARTVVSLAKGRSLTGAMLDQVKEQFPGAEQAIAVAAGIAHGRNLQELAISEVKSLAVDQIKSLKLPIPEGVKVPIQEQGGFKIALGVLQNSKLPSGVPLTPAAALAIRQRLTPVARMGFDRAMGMRAMKHYKAGSPHIPAPAPILRGATLITARGMIAL